ncbi:MAG: helicase-related protein [bacterium]|nr:helicase-related protein [bacterium]
MVASSIKNGSRDSGQKRGSFDSLSRETRIRQECQNEIERLRQTTDLAERKLPIESVKGEYISAMEHNNVISVEATTGAGKSLDIGVWTLEQLGEGARIAVTQPRRDAAQGVAIATAARHNLKFGNDICFSTSEFHGNQKDTKLQISTTGVLINKFRTDPILSEYDAVVVDEAHERDLNIDLTLGLLKQANILREEQGLKAIKIIVCSATLEQNKFAEFFGIKKEGTIKAEGKLHKVEETYTSEKDTKYFDDRSQRQRKKPYTKIATEHVVNILKNSSEGDILVFMPGIKSIKNVIESVEEQISDKNVEVLMLHGSNTQRDRSYVLQGSRDERIRRVVVSTNMAETSVTVPGVRYVVDGARKNDVVYDVDCGLEGLQDVPASKSECLQRKGRAGRITEGEYISVLTEEQFDRLDDHPVPEMLRRDLDSVVLKMLRLGIKDVENFDLPDRPDPEYVKEAIRKLIMWDAITPERDLTESGKIMADLPLDPRHGRVVVSAIENGCVNEAVSVTSIVGNAQIFKGPTKAEKEKEGAPAANERYKQKQMRLRDEGMNSDWLFYLKIFNEFKAVENKRAFCEEYALQYESLEKVVADVYRIIRILKMKGIEISSTDDEEELTKSILTGYAPDHLVSKNGRFQYSRVDRGGGNVRIVPNSILFTELPQLAVGTRLDRKVIERDYGETEVFYAAGLHPTNMEQLYNAVPNRVKRENIRNVFTIEDGKVMTQYNYSFLDRNNKWVEMVASFSHDRNSEATKYLGKYIYDLQYSLGSNELNDFFHVQDNIETVQDLSDLHARSRGKVSSENIEAWYAKQLGDCVSIEEAKKLGSDHFILDREKVINKEEEEQIERDMPNLVSVGGVDYSVKYNLDSSGYYTHDYNGKTPLNVVFGLEGKSVDEVHNIIMNFPDDITDKFKKSVPGLEDFDIIRLKIPSYFFSLSNIESLKIRCEGRYVEDKISELNNNTNELIEVKRGEKFPNLKNLGFEPINLGVLQNGEELIVYPAFISQYRGRNFTIKYFYHKSDANWQNRAAKELIAELDHGVMGIGFEVSSENRTLGTIGDALVAKSSETKPKQESVVDTKPAVVEKEVMTDELKVQFQKQIQVAETLIDAMKPFMSRPRSGSDSANKGKKKEKISDSQKAMETVYNRYASLKADIIFLKKQFESDDSSVESIRGKLNSIDRDISVTFNKQISGRITNEIADNWIDVYKQALEKIIELTENNEDAKEYIVEGLVTKDALLAKMQERLILLAQKGEKIDEEAILLDVLSEF